MAYDKNNVFAKILRDELPSKRVYEDEHALAFHDINPLTPVHVLVIPKGEYVDYQDFVDNAPAAAVAGFFRAVGHVARQVGVAEDGYRVVSNKGAPSGQVVFHFHVHIFGGRPLGGMIRRPKGEDS